MGTSCRVCRNSGSVYDTNSSLGVGREAHDVENHCQSDETVSLSSDGTETQATNLEETAGVEDVLASSTLLCRQPAVGQRYNTVADSARLDTFKVQRDVALEERQRVGNSGILRGEAPSVDCDVHIEWKTYAARNRLLHGKHPCTPCVLADADALRVTDLNRRQWVVRRQADG